MEGSESYHKITQEADDTYSTDYGWGLYKDDDNSSAKSSKYRRTYTWNERNQLISSVDSNYSTAYVYGQDGQRSNKYTQNSETLYFNKMWTLHTDSGNSVYGGQTAKNIYLGETRIVTKLNGANYPTYQEEYYKQYYYHSDHLGSASLISDYNGDEYQRIEYTPYGETWVEKTSNTGMEYLPYKFTAKELDEETGLYYYGARYLDPKYSMWISTDPALGEYMSKDYDGTSGGIFNFVNFNLYHYSSNNPLKYTDPDGREAENGLDSTAAFRLEDPIGAGKLPLYDSKTGEPIMHNGKQLCYDKEIDTVLGKAGEFLYGSYDGAEDKDGNFYKASARSPFSVNFKLSKEKIEMSGLEKLKNDIQDFYKEKIDKSGLLTSDYYPKGSDGANRLRNSWEPTIERDVGTPDQWDSNYNSDVQYSLRKYLKDSFIEYQKMKLLMFRTGAMKW